MRPLRLKHRTLARTRGVVAPGAILDEFSDALWFLQIDTLHNCRVELQPVFRSHYKQIDDLDALTHSVQILLSSGCEIAILVVLEIIEVDDWRIKWIVGFQRDLSSKTCVRFQQQPGPFVVRSCDGLL